MKKATVKLGTLVVACPECNALVRHPNTGQLFWSAVDVRAAEEKSRRDDYGPENALMCVECGCFMEVETPTLVAVWATTPAD